MSMHLSPAALTLLAHLTWLFLEGHRRGIAVTVLLATNVLADVLQCAVDGAYEGENAQCITPSFLAEDTSDILQRPSRS